jgi:hypothetical protein
VQLGVDEPAVVVLDGDHDGVAQAARAPDLVALPGHAMSRRVELRSLVGVEMQQHARLAPLKALERLTLAASATRDAVAPEHAVDRRAVAADQRRQPQSGHPSDTPAP